MMVVFYRNGDEYTNFTPEVVTLSPYCSRFSPIERRQRRRPCEREASLSRRLATPSSLKLGWTTSSFSRHWLLRQNKSSAHPLTRSPLSSLLCNCSLMWYLVSQKINSPLKYDCSLTHSLMLFFFSQFIHSRLNFEPSK